MSTRRPKSVLDQDRYTAELSTGQLVIGVCILLMFGLGCFLLGVLIGKFDPTLKTAGVERSADDPGDDKRTPEIKVSELPAANNPPATVTQSVPPAAEPVLPPEMRAPANVVREDAAPDPAAQSPAPATNTQTNAAAPPPATTSVEVVQQSATENTAAPAPHGVSESVAAAAERNRIAPPTQQPQAVNAAPTTTQPAAAAQQTPAPADNGSLTPWKGFGVQILAVAKDRAEGARKDLEAKSSYKARVLPHSRNDLYRVVVGPYADQTSAAKARDDLRARGFRDAFVLTLQ